MTLSFYLDRHSVCKCICWNFQERSCGQTVNRCRYLGGVCKIPTPACWTYSTSPFLVYFLFKKETSDKDKARQANVFFLFLFSVCSSFPLLLPANIRVIDELPVANKVLLQHLVCVLHHILENADINKMDSYNLAVCIAPTLLQLNTTPLDEQKDRIEKVESFVMYILSHFWCFEALWFTVSKTSKGFMSKVTAAQTGLFSLDLAVCLEACQYKIHYPAWMTQYFL